MRHTKSTTLTLRFWVISEWLLYLIFSAFHLTPRLCICWLICIGRWLERKGYKIVWGVGRHLLGSQIFDYWWDTSGFMIEVMCIFLDFYTG